MTSCSVRSPRDAAIASSMSRVRATTEERTPGHRLSMNQGTSSRRPGTTASQVTTANGHVRKARASGSLKSRLLSGRADSSARKSALCSAVRLAWPSRMAPDWGSRLCLEYSALVGQWSVEFRAPGGGVWVRLRARDVAFPQVRGRRVPVGRDPGIELARGGNRRRDGHADLEVKGVWVHPQVVREPWPGGGDALGGDGGHQLADSRTHDIPDLLPRNGQGDDGG